tara:strand:+ start:537 stop:785 length:249 start_codon:yes stop_codon:yes gene_type:complete
MNFVEAELHNESLCDLDPEPNPDLIDPDLDEVPNPDHDEEGPIWQEDPEWDDDLVALFDEIEGLTAEGYALLAEMDAMGDFI